MITAAAALAASCLNAQDIEKVIADTKTALRDPVTVSGSIGASAVFYRSFGIQPRRDPFYWVLNANLNFTLFNKVSVPFTAVFTQQDKNFSNGLDRFSQPFNQYGLSPRYRWLTVHAGYRSLNFSEYSLSGVLWLGGGVEIRPERSLVSGSAFYGRFLKAVPQGGIDGIVVSVPSYQRMGGGAKVRVGTETSFGECSFLRVKDIIGSIPYDTSLSISPQENQVVSFAGRHQLLPWISASGEISLSMFTKNLFEDTYTPARFSYVNQLFDTRPSTQFNKAINTALDFSPGRLQYGIRYKRIDPDYRSLGAIFLTNDVEEISVNSGAAVFKGKLSTQVAAGVQRNNLDGRQQLSARRFIGSCNITYAPAEYLSFSGNYSNFSSNTIAERNVFNDSIRFVQLTQNFGSSAGFAFGKRLKQHLTLSGTYQESMGTQQLKSEFLNGTLSYQLMAGESGWSLNLSALYNQVKNEGLGLSNGYGPQVSIQRSMLNNRLRISASGGFQENFLNDMFLSRNIVSSAALFFSISQNQNLRCDLSWLSREAQQVGVQSFSEIRLNMGYTYNFSASAGKFGKRR